MDYKLTGIILEKYDLAEADRTYGIYTQEEGRIRVIGKGVRKAGAKLAGFLEPITYGEFFIAKNKGAGKVTGAIIHNNFEKIKNNYPATEKVFESLKVFRKIITGQESDRVIFDLIRDYLEEMEGTVSDSYGDVDVGKKIEIITLGFRYKLFEISGYNMVVDRCSMCQKKLERGINYFSVERGGTVCFNCASRVVRKVGVSEGAIKLMRLFISNGLKNYRKIVADDSDLKSLRMVINEVTNWITT